MGERGCKMLWSIFLRVRRFCLQLPAMILTIDLDIALSIVEVPISFKSPKLVLVGVDANKFIDTDVYQHELLQITLKNKGGVYALDLTGAQYGYFEPVIAWEEYAATRIEKYALPE